ncbi:MAG: valine--tRNA ligase [Candidatus Delongbacteria bacterium]|jgi:valyl-tRNA synthetase|nr:valine--tRNA ligase [Candidatus Delongbacteria bacterium]
MSEINTAYDPKNIETKLYKKWTDNGFFKGKINKDKEPYAIVIPPPNVTGILHIGHVLNNTIQDIYIRWNKLKGKETIWIPGTDHASIATENKVVQKLADQGIKKEDIGREKFLEEAQKWKDEHGGIIIEQLKKIGCACDWERERFTMDEMYSERVIDTFIDLHKKGLIYKGYRLVNWCPVSQSVISDEEVLFEEKNGKLWYFNYPIKDSDEHVTIATTRPETMFGDTAIAIHPENEKLNHLIGKTAILPFMDRELPIIADEYADPEKGTGAVKITPAHDPNDNRLGKKHNLKMITVINKDATMNNQVPEEFIGLDRYVARKLVVKKLTEMGLVEKIQDHVHQVSISERGKVPIEYLMSEQWYLGMDELVKPAIEVVKQGKIKFHPGRWEKTYYNWLDNIQDWCISRQLWWGHRIPAYYCSNPGCNEVIMVEKDQPAVCSKCGKSDGIYQDNDVLDTWASSWLWPFGVHTNKEEEEYFYPTNLLVTAPDIIFFWVARMIIAGMEYKNEIPFHDVYFHGVVRDEKGRRMSKSLGNSPDPLDIIDEYGADALRFTMVRLTPTGNDIQFSKEKCDLGRNFANKVWNASRFLLMHREQFSGQIEQKIHLDQPEDRWINSRLQQTIQITENKIKEFQPNEAVKAVYEFLWNDLCDWYIEMAKSRLQSDDNEAKKAVLENAFYVFDIALKLLHPFMPFITEELWMSIETRDENDSIMLSSLPDFDKSLISQEAEDLMEIIKDIIGKVRNVRAENNIPMSKELNIILKSDDTSLSQFSSVIKHLGKIGEITFDPNVEAPKLASSFVVSGTEIFIPLEGIIDIGAEKEKINKEIKRLEGINFGINKKLGNEKFVSNAPEQVITKEKDKLTTNLDAIEKLKKSLENLG